MPAATAAAAPRVTSGTRPSSMSAWVTQAPSTIASVASSTCFSSAIAVMSTSRSGCDQPQIEHRPERLTAGDDLDHGVRRAASERERGRRDRRTLHSRKRPASCGAPGRVARCAIASTIAARRDRRMQQLDAQAAASASLTALAIAAGGAMAPPSPMPFDAELACRATASPCDRAAAPAPRSGPAADSRRRSRRAAGPTRRTASPRRARCRCPARGRHRSGRRRSSD